MTALQLELPRERLSGALSDCTDIDTRALGAVLGIEVAIDSKPLHIASGELRECEMFDRSELGSVLYVEAGFGPIATPHLEPIVPVTGYASVEGIGDTAGYQVMESSLWGDLGALRIEAGGATMYIYGRDPSADTPLSLEQLASASVVVADGLWSSSANAPIGAFTSCADLPFTELVGSPLGEFVAFTFAGRSACVAEASSGDRLQVSVGQRDDAPEYVEEINYTLGNFFWNPAARRYLDSSELDDRFTAGLLIDNHEQYSGNDLDPVLVDRIALAAPGLFVEVAAMGQVAADDGLSSTELQDLALVVLDG